MYLLRLVLAWDVVKESRLLITMAEGKDPYRLDGVSNRSSPEEGPPPSSRPPALSSLSDPEPMAAVCLPTLPTLLFERRRGRTARPSQKSTGWTPRVARASEPRGLSFASPFRQLHRCPNPTLLVWSAQQQS